MLRLITLFLVAFAVRAACGQTPTASDTKSCCKTTLSRTALLTAANVADEKAAKKDTATNASNVSPKGWPAKPWPEGMVWIPGGEFSMGAATNGHGSSEMPMASNDAEPIHRVYVDGFWMDA